MEQTKALNALEPFLALSKSATSPRAAADLITRATSASGTFIFTELLQTPQIQALKQSPEYASYLTVLEVFSYGTYQTYHATPNLPALNDAQTQKLRQLSLLTLATNPHNLRYATLQTALGLDTSSPRALEDLVISAIYADLITAQLDPYNQLVRVSSVSPLRDLAPGSIPATLASLKEWSDRCTGTLADLEAQIESIRAGAAARHAESRAAEETQKRLLEDLEKTNPNENAVHGPRQTNMISRAVAKIGGRGGSRFGKRGSGSLDGGVDDDEAMDLDDDDYDDEGAAAGLGSGSKDGGAKRRGASRRKL